MIAHGPSGVYAAVALKGGGLTDICDFPEDRSFFA